ncbi:hypothetical protein SD427_16995 [Chryseobacterium sp. JJR-5R]|uniref:hypothetical protein n=1 Tax=Chryseobacterium sp. JJR-5R TaxID=3093923 RepID=UPI002A766936|nr:hypothetical protein [Chryseobacterium sp. JJR-5R]WPO82440.1 hypothetical protein SD427_16995 [Chryseobacterium sp. JJR-5R]
MKNNPAYAARFQREAGDIYFDLRSLTYGETTKGLAYPIMKDGMVNAVLVAMVNEQRDWITFIVLKNSSPEVTEMISKFQKFYDTPSAARGREQMQEEQIEEVVIVVYQSIPGPSYIYYQPYTDYGSSGGLGLGMSGGPTIHQGGGFYNPSQNNNPCAKLKAQNNDATFKAKIDYLKTKTGESFEYGFRVNNPPPGQTATQYQQLSNVVGSNTIDFKFFNTTYGYMHSHFERLIPIFSPDDINTFIKLLINAHNNNIPQENVFMNVVNPDGTIYQLRGDNINVGSLTIYEQNIIDKELNNIYVNDYKLGEPNQSPEFYQENFLKFMKDNMNINGAKMYSIDNNGKASQLSLNGNSLDNSIPCPN